MKNHILKVSLEFKDMDVVILDFKKQLEELIFEEEKECRELVLNHFNSVEEFLKECVEYGDIERYIGLCINFDFRYFYGEMNDFSIELSEEKTPPKLFSDIIFRENSILLYWLLTEDPGFREKIKKAPFIDYCSSLKEMDFDTILVIQEKIELLGGKVKLQLKNEN